MALNFITDFGGVGNGVADDTAAMKAAMEYAGDVFFPDPPAFYRLTGEIVLTTNLTGKKYGNPPTNLTYGSLGELQSGTWTCFIKLDNSTRNYNNTSDVPIGHYKMFYLNWGKSVTNFEFANFHISVIWESDPTLALENKQKGYGTQTWDYYRFSFWMGDVQLDGYHMHHCSWNFDDCWSGGPCNIATGDSTPNAQVKNMTIEYNIFNCNQVAGIIERTSRSVQPWDRITVTNNVYRYNTCIAQGNVGGNAQTSSTFVGITFSGARNTHRMQGLLIHNNYMKGFGYSAVEHAYDVLADFDCGHVVSDNIFDTNGPQQGTSGNACTINNYYNFQPVGTRIPTGGTINNVGYYMLYKISYVTDEGVSVPTPVGTGIYISSGSTNSIALWWKQVPDTEGHPIIGYKLYRRNPAVDTNYYFLTDVPPAVGEVTFTDNGSYTPGSLAPTTGLSWDNKFFRYKGFKFQRNVIINSWIRDVFKDLDGALITDNEYIRTIDSTDLRLLEAKNWKNTQFSRNTLTYDTPRAWTAIGMSSFQLADNNHITDNNFNVTYGLYFQIGKNNIIANNVMNHASSAYAGLMSNTQGSIYMQSDVIKYPQHRNNFIKNTVYLKAGSLAKSVYNQTGGSLIPIMDFDESSVYVGGVLQTNYPKTIVTYSAPLTDLSLQNSELAKTFTLVGSPSTAWSCKLPGRFGIYTITNSSGQDCTISCYNGLRTAVIPAGETKVVKVDDLFNCDFVQTPKLVNYNGITVSV